MNAGPIKSLSSPFMHSCYSRVHTVKGQNVHMGKVSFVTLSEILNLADKIIRKELIMNTSVALALWLQVPANFPLVLSCELPFNSIGML